MQKASQAASSAQRRESSAKPQLREASPATPSSIQFISLELRKGKPEREAPQHVSLPAFADEHNSELLYSNGNATAAAHSSHEQQPVSLPAGKPPGSAPSQQQARSCRLESISDEQLRSASENRRAAGDERRRPRARSRNSPQRGRAADKGRRLAQARSRDSPERGRNTGSRDRDRSRDSPERGRHTGSRDRDRSRDSPERGRHTGSPSRSSTKRARSRDSPQRGHRGQHKPDSAAERIASQAQRELAPQVSAILQLLLRVTLTTIRKCVADSPS